MSMKFVTRALVVAGLLVAGVTASFAQTGTPCASKARRVLPGTESKQPVAPSAIILSSKMSLNAEQKAKVAAMNTEVASLQAERARLWSEYRAVRQRPDFDDNMAEKEAAPRMRRIMQINAQLAPIVARQDAQLASLLTSSQQAELARMVANAKASL